MTKEETDAYVKSRIRIIDPSIRAIPIPGKLLPITRINWPIFLMPMKLLAIESDKGLGDIIARTIGPLGGEEFKAWYKKIFGKECGCTARQESWNAMYPL